jgi:hypothetical protein
MYLRWLLFNLMIEGFDYGRLLVPFFSVLGVAGICSVYSFGLGVSLGTTWFGIGRRIVIECMFLFLLSFSVFGRLLCRFNVMYLCSLLAAILTGKCNYTMNVYRVRTFQLLLKATICNLSCRFCLLVAQVC